MAWRQLFRSASGACAAALAAQRALAGEVWPDDVALKVRMGLHSGEADERAGDYFGPAVNRAARVMALAHGGQVLLSGATAELVRDQLAAGWAVLEVGEYPLRGLLRSEHLSELVAEDLGNRFGSVCIVGPQRGNLPSPVTSFIGRVGPLQRLAGEMHRRLVTVTVTGPGGVGKTRLAVEVAHRVADGFAGGVWLCELAPLRDPGAVPFAVTEALGFRFQDDEDLAQMLIDGLRSRGRTLVIIDNCEHLLDAAAALVGSITAACPETTVLATSREPLGVEGERVHNLGPLDLVSEATALFVERAESADQAFSPTGTDLEIVRQICTRLDGMPLALELAAARVRAFSLGDLARRLENRLALLRNPARGADRRHETLRAALDWSYQLLDKPSRRLFSRLAVFVGGFDLAALEAVCGTDIDDEPVVELLAGLVDKSLVVPDRSGPVTRYRLLDTMRQFASETLDDPSAEWQDRHLDYYVAGAKTAADNYAEAGFDAACHWFDAEWDNLRAAFSHALSVDQLSAAVAITEHTFWWSVNSVRAEHAEWLQKISGTTSCPIFVTALRAAWSVFIGDHVEAELLARRVIAESDDPVATWHAWHAVGEVSFHSGRLSETLQAFAVMADAAARCGERTYDVHTKYVANMVLGITADHERTARTAADLERHASQTGNTLYWAIALAAAGSAALAAGDRQRANRRFTESADLCAATGLGMFEGAALSAAVLGATGPERPARYRHALGRVQDTRNLVHVWIQLEGLGSTWALEGRHHPAAILLGAVDARGHHVPQLDRRRARAEIVLSKCPERPDWAAIGAAMDVDQILTYALEQLDLEIAEQS